MKQFSNVWKKSSKKSKQIKYRLNAPLHTKRKFMRSPLSKELKQKYDKRNISVRTGDKVKIMRGQFKGKEGRIEKVIIKDMKIHVSGTENVKRDGSKTFYPIAPSNVMITTLDLDDKKREIALKRKGNTQSKAKKEQNIEKKQVEVSK